MTVAWSETLKDIQSKLSDENFTTWIAPCLFAGVHNASVKLTIPNRFYAEWISAHYESMILECVNLHSKETIRGIEWNIDESLQAPTPRVEQSEEPVRKRKDTNGAKSGPRNFDSAPPELQADLNPKYNFDKFVVGPSNQLAHATCVAVGSDPGKRYNPLFLYGGVGLGKTHLMNAMGHTVLGKTPGVRILYLSAERFTNEFIWSLQNHRIDEFRERYRHNCDMLLMDDIQFLAGRDQTQEEFFHTFNALYHQDKQIVVTSDVYPQQIGRMEERLVSRFQSGMVADIQPPELDTRIAILQKKAESESIELPNEVAHFLAQIVKSNVRELEGTLIRLAVKAELLGREIDLELARESMKGFIPQVERATNVDDIQKAVCAYFGVKLSELKGKRRHRAVSFPRQIAMFLCRERLGTSYPEIGQRFGGKDHTTVISAVRKIAALLEDEDDSAKSAIQSVDRQLGI